MSTLRLYLAQLMSELSMLMPLRKLNLEAFPLFPQESALFVELG